MAPHLALVGGGAHEPELLLLLLVGGILRNFLQHVGPGRSGDVHVIQQGCAVAGGAWEGVLLGAVLCNIRK